MYIVDFAKRLLRKQNTGLIVYLVLNTLIVMLLFQNWLLGLTLYVASLVAALSPLGEWILRIQNGCRRVEEGAMKERLQPLFEEVYERAKELDPSISDNVQLFVTDEQSPNAFATGRKTICLTTGLIGYSDSKIKATLAHEFGHLSHKDTDLVLVVAVGNMIVSFMFLLYRLFITVAGTVVSIANRSIGSLIVSFFIDWVLVAMMWLWTKFGTALVMHTSRQNEFEADDFARRIGYGEPLIDVLSSFERMEAEGAKGLWANLAASHPAPTIRIEKLNMKQAV